MTAIRYTGTANADTRFHDGALRPVIGACNIQVMRANREHPEYSQPTGYTYNHAPMLCRWHRKMYLMYLSSSVHEHCGHAHAMLASSRDGFTWSRPEVIFPSIPVPAGIYRGKSPESLPPDALSVVHHRMGFYRAPNDVLIAMTFHGVSPHIHAAPNSGYGMGRVVRRIFPDGTFGPIYVLRINSQAGWNIGHFPYSLYTSSPDADFVAACDSVLSDVTANGAWWEEERLDADFFPLKNIKAPSFCELADGTLAAIGKSGLYSLSNDNGRSWTVPEKADGISTSGGKCCLTRTGDGRYSIIYNPSPDGQHRWPLAVITGDDGSVYTDMLCVCGEVPPMRYGGWLKNIGPQYIRTIMPMNNDSPDGYTWLVYSMNKEDIWLARLPRTLSGIETDHVSDDFSAMPGPMPEKWHIYSPQSAPVRIENGCLTLRDADPYDYAKAVRQFPSSEKAVISVDISANPAENGPLHIEVSDSKGMSAARLIFAADHTLRIRGGDGQQIIYEYAAGEELHISIDIDCRAQQFHVIVNSTADKPRPFMCPATSVERLTFRTGPVRTGPTPEDELKNVCPPDLPYPGEACPESFYRIRRVKIT